VRWFLVAIAVCLAAGCGGRQEQAKSEQASDASEAAFQPSTRCTHVSRGFRACTTYRERGEQTGIYRRAGSDWVKVVGPAPGRMGWWRRVIASPNRITLLGQWSGECETQTTYIVRTGETTRPIFAQAESYALGWSNDGRARVRVPMTSPDPRGNVHAGIYLVDPRTLAHTLERSMGRGPAC